MSSFYDEYQRKLKTADEAVRIVKSGDWVDYGTNIGLLYTLYPWGKDKASISNVYMLSNNYSGYSAYYPKEKSGWFYLSMWQLSTDSDTDYWGTFNFWIDQ